MTEEEDFFFFRGFKSLVSLKQTTKKILYILLYALRRFSLEFLRKFSIMAKNVSSIFFPYELIFKGGVRCPGKKNLYWYTRIDVHVLCSCVSSESTPLHIYEGSDWLTWFQTSVLLSSKRWIKTLWLFIRGFLFFFPDNYEPGLL